MSKKTDTPRPGSRHHRTQHGAASTRHGASGDPCRDKSQAAALRKILFLALAVIVMGGAVIGVQTARVDTASAEANYLRQRLHSVLGLAELREEVIQLHRTLHDAESAYIGALHNRLERVALRTYIQRTNPRAPAEQIADHIQACAELYAVEPQLVLAVMQQESHFKHRAEGDHGERGLMQLTKPTATELGVIWEEAFDIKTNVCAGTRYLAGLVARFGAPEIAAQHYNGGGDPLYAMRVSRHLLRIAREFPRNELAPRRAEIMADLARKQAAEVDVSRTNF